MNFILSLQNFVVEMGGLISRYRDDRFFRWFIAVTFNVVGLWFIFYFIHIHFIIPKEYSLNNYLFPKDKHIANEVVKFGN